MLLPPETNNLGGIESFSERLCVIPKPKVDAKGASFLPFRVYCNQEIQKNPPLIDTRWSYDLLATGPDNRNHTTNSSPTNHTTNSSPTNHTTDSSPTLGTNKAYC